MLWLIVAVVVLIFLLPRLARHERGVPTFPGQPISTLHSEMSKKTNRKTKAALAAATRLLQ